MKVMSLNKEIYFLGMVKVKLFLIKILIMKNIMMVNGI